MGKSPGSRVRSPRGDSQKTVKMDYQQIQINNNSRKLIERRIKVDLNRALEIKNLRLESQIEFN
jgi:hypothetical protein